MRSHRSFRRSSLHTSLVPHLMRGESTPRTTIPGRVRVKISTTRVRAILRMSYRSIDLKIIELYFTIKLETLY